MSTIQYDDTPLPVGNPITLNNNENAYELGFFDGSDYGDQFADDPDDGVTFESPKAARAWLDAVTAVLSPYIERGDRDVRVPNATGWGED